MISSGKFDLLFRETIYNSHHNFVLQYKVVPLQSPQTLSPSQAQLSHLSGYYNWINSYTMKQNCWAQEKGSSLEKKYHNVVLTTRQLWQMSMEGNYHCISTPPAVFYCSIL